jgi:Fe-S oxidoreductase
MGTVLISPAEVSILGIPGAVFSLLIPLVGVGILVYLVARRMAPLFRAAPDPRTDNIKKRLFGLYEFPHHRMPRYKFSGAIHITTIICLAVLSLQVITFLLEGISAGFTLPGLDEGFVGTVYRMLTDIALTVLLATCIVALYRRGISKPERYKVLPRYGEDRTHRDALLSLFLLALLAVLDSVYIGSHTAAAVQNGVNTRILLPGTGIWMAASVFSLFPASSLQAIYIISYFSLNILIFAFLCYLPFGRFFHLITGPPNVFFRKLKKGTVKPVKWGVDESKFDEIESFGVKKFEDFTWKHMLDFYACTDCGRCSDQCPANAVGRPLSPRFISIKGRDYAFKKYSVFGSDQKQEELLVGSIYNEDEIWSCTTCGACEQECPVMIEYIDKIVDLRRGMVDEGMVPQSLQKPLSALEKRGNPWGKMEKKRADWTKGLPVECNVKMIEKGETAETLYFVDSITSYDDRMQNIGRAAAKILSAAGIDFGILGSLEKDSGNEVRRFGEEMLFQDLKSNNTGEIVNSGVKNIVTSDPHAFNALKNDYSGLPPVEHISQTIVKCVKSGKIKLKGIEDGSKIYTYHDPCYLGRHNDVYEDPRAAIDAIPGINRVDMEKCRDRSFCCGGGGLMLFYEPEEEQRMGVLRVEMAKKAGANVIVTACPFCLVNIEDAIKVSGMEGKMEAIDLAELIETHIADK